VLFYVGTRSEEGDNNRVVRSNALSILNFKYVLIFVVKVLIIKLIICKVAN